MPVEDNNSALELEKKIKDRFRKNQVKSSEILQAVTLDELKAYITLA